MIGTLQNHVTVTPVNNTIAGLCRYEQEVYYITTSGAVYRSLDNGANFSYMFDTYNSAALIGIRANNKYIVIYAGKYLYVYDKSTKKELRSINLYMDYSYDNEKKTLILDDYIIVNTYTIELSTGKAKSCNYPQYYNASQNGIVIESNYFLLSAETVDTNRNYTIKIYKNSFNFASASNSNTLIRTSYITLPSTPTASFNLVTDKIITIDQGDDFYFYNMESNEFISSYDIGSTNYYKYSLNNVDNCILLYQTLNNGIYTYDLYCDDVCLYECESTKASSYLYIASNSDDYYTIYNPSTNEIITIKIAKVKGFNTFSISEFITDDKTAFLTLKENTINGGTYNIIIKENVCYVSELSVIENIKGYTSDSKQFTLKENVIYYNHANNKLSTWELIKFKYGEFGSENKKLQLSERIDPPYRTSLTIKENAYKKPDPVTTIETLSGRYIIDEYNAYSSPTIVSLDYSINSSYVLAGPRAMYKEISTTLNRDYQSYPYMVKYSVSYSSKKRYLLIDASVNKKMITSYTKVANYVYKLNDISSDSYTLYSSDFTVVDQNNNEKISYSKRDTYDNKSYFVYELPNRALNLKITVSSSSYITMAKDSIKILTIDTPVDIFNITENITAFSQRLTVKDDVYLEKSFKHFVPNFIDNSIYCAAGTITTINTSGLGKNNKYFFDIDYDDNTNYEFTIIYSDNTRVEINNDNLVEYTAIYCGKENMITKRDHAKGFILEIPYYCESFRIMLYSEAHSFTLNHIYDFVDRNECNYGTDSLFVSEQIKTQAANIYLTENVISYIDGYKNLNDINEYVYQQGTNFGKTSINAKEEVEGLRGYKTIKICENIPAYSTQDNYIYNDLYRIDLSKYYNDSYYMAVNQPGAKSYIMRPYEAMMININQDRKDIDFLSLYSLKLQTYQDMDKLDIIIGYDEKIGTEGQSFVKIKKVTTVNVRYGWNNYDFLACIQNMVNKVLDYKTELDSDYNHSDRIIYFGITANIDNKLGSYIQTDNTYECIDKTKMIQFKPYSGNIMSALESTEYLSIRDLFAYHKSLKTYRSVNVQENILMGTTDQLRGLFYPEYLGLGKPLSYSCIYYNESAQVYDDDSCVIIKSPEKDNIHYFSPKRVYIVTNRKIKSVYGYKKEYHFASDAEEFIYEYTGFEDKYVKSDDRYYYDFFLYDKNGGAADNSIQSLCINLNTEDNTGENFKQYTVLINECAIWLNGYMKNEKLLCRDNILSYMPSANCLIKETIIQPAVSLPVKEFYTRDRGGTRILSMAERIIRPNDKFGDSSINMTENIKPFVWHKDIDVVELVPCEPIKDNLWIYETIINNTKCEIPIKEKVVNIKNGKDAKVMIEVVKH